MAKQRQIKSDCTVDTFEKKLMDERSDSQSTNVVKLKALASRFKKIWLIIKRPKTITMNTLVVLNTLILY